MSSLTKEIVDSYGTLTAVREGERLGASGPVTLTLGFEHGVVLVSADADDDTIMLTPTGPPSGRDLSAEAPCAERNRTGFDVDLDADEPAGLRGRVPV